MPAPIEKLHQAPSSSDYNHADDANWSYTMMAVDVASLRRQYEREAGRKERHSISRDSEIDGGVYEGSYGGEAIVVDSEKYPVGFRDAMSRINQRIFRPDGSLDKSMVLESVYNVVSEMMKYDQSAVDAIFAQDCNGVDGTKISLDTYVRDGVGVCRHQALFAGQLLEALGKQGIVSGKASVERNMVRNKTDKFDGHSWVRYVNSIGDVFIIDVAQHRIAPLEQLMAERAAGKEVWDYARPEDHQKVRGRQVMDTVVIQDAWAAGRSVDDGRNAAGLIDRIPDWVNGR